MTRSPVFHVITPAFRRSSRLRRFVGALRKQRYPHWTGYIVHDGPNAAFQSDYLARPAPDARVRFAMTTARTGDMGNSQRMWALDEVSAKAGPDDYCVLWDDDNYFFPDALASIADALNATGYPDLLLVPLKYGGGTLPPREKPVSQLELGEVDSGCLVLRAACYPAIRDRLANVADCYLFDIELFKAMRACGGAVVGASAMPPIGEYDGLRYFPRFVTNRPRAQWRVFWLSIRRLVKSVEQALAR